MSTAEAQFKTESNFGYGYTEPQLTLTDTQEVGRELTRFLFFAGDVISPQQKFEREDLAMGGETVDSPCMWRFSRFLRSCVVTPLEMGAWPTPREMIPEGVEPVAIRQEQLTTQGAMGQWATSLSAQPLLGLPCHPGDQLAWILTKSLNNTGNLRKGIVEIEELRGGTFSDWVDSGLQTHFFPVPTRKMSLGKEETDIFVMPTTLREREALIRSGLRDPSSEIQRIGQKMLSSLAQFRVWATDRIEIENGLLRLGPPPGSGLVFGYSPLAEVLFEQTELPRKDFEAKNSADLNERMVSAIEALASQQTGQRNVSSDDVIAAIQANPEAFAEILQGLIPKNKGGRPRKEEVGDTT